MQLTCKRIFRNLPLVLKYIYTFPSRLLTLSANSNGWKANIIRYLIKTKHMLISSYLPVKRWAADSSRAIRTPPEAP